MSVIAILDYYCGFKKHAVAISHSTVLVRGYEVPKKEIIVALSSNGRERRLSHLAGLSVSEIGDVSDYSIRRAKDLSRIRELAASIGRDLSWLQAVQIVEMDEGGEFKEKLELLDSAYERILDSFGKNAEYSELEFFLKDRR